MVSVAIFWYLSTICYKKKFESKHVKLKPVISLYKAMQVKQNKNNIIMIL